MQIHGVGRTFPGNVVALEQITLSIAPGEFISILGPSGCGKSTLLRLIASLDRPTHGNISGVEKLAYVFQDAHLLPWRNLRRNVELPLELSGVSRSQRRSQAEAMLEQVGLADAMKRYPARLSGGMRMRASLARALVSEPKLLLLDEPFAALDEITRQHLDEQLRQLWASRHMTVVFVTHSTAEAVFLSDRAVVMSKRPGRVILDQQIDLPKTRDATLRGSGEFAAQTRAIYQALERA